MWHIIKSINLSKAISRFPASCIWSILGTFIAMYIVSEDQYFTSDEDIRFQFLIISFFGFLGSISITLLKESRAWSMAQVIIAHLVWIVICGFGFRYIHYVFPLDNTLNYRLPFQLMGLFMVLHLFVSFLPFFSKGENGDFWEYNRKIFLRLVESIFFAIFLFATLSLALVALDQLFGLNIDSKTYLYLWILLLGIFQSWYFLSKFPDLNYDNKVDTPDRVYLIFTQYLLIPITLIYMSILFAYAIKLGINMSLPQGWVGKLSLSFAVVGVFAYLMNYYNDQFSQLKFVRQFRDHFFTILILPIVLIFISIGRRISDYGMTEQRYLVLAAGIWLLSIAILYGLRKNKDLKWIPISLSGIILIALFSGPLSMFSTTISSQKNRLYDSLISQNRLVDGKLVKITDTKGANTLMDMIQFMDDRTDMQFVNEWVEPQISFHNENVIDSSESESNASIVLNALDIENYNGYAQDNGIEYFNYYTTEEWPINIAGYDTLITFYSYKEFNPNANLEQIYLDPNDHQFYLMLKNGSKLPVDITDRILTLKNSGNSEAFEPITVKLEDSDRKFLVLFKSVSGNYHSDNRVTIDSGEGFLLIE